MLDHQDLGIFIDKAISAVAPRFWGIRDHNFIVITSPMGRAGTTAIYRVFRNNTDFIAYGEDHHPFKILAMLFSQAAWSVKNTNFQRAVFQKDSKEKDSWEVLSLPPQPILTSTSLECAYFYMSSYVSECKKGQTVVIKKPSARINFLSSFQKLFPNTKFIFLHRDVRECIMSNISYSPMKKFYETDIENWIKNWISESTKFHNFPKKNKIILDYAKISPAYVKNIFEKNKILLTDSDYKILHKKVNNYDSYIKPVKIPESFEKYFDRNKDEIDRVNLLFQMDKP